MPVTKQKLIRHYAMDRCLRLLREMPGLRGYSETSLKNMRKFYDAWQILDIKSSVATDHNRQLRLSHRLKIRQLRLPNVRPQNRQS